VSATQRLAVLIGEQPAIRRWLAACQLGADHRPVAIRTALAARADRAQTATIGLAHQAEAVEKLTAERDACHAGHLVLRRLGHRPGRLAHHHITQLEHQRAGIHPTGALSLWSCGF